MREGGREIATDLNAPELQSALVARHPSIQGFRETDPPNFSFRRPPCSFYSGTKALAEELISDDELAYIWRLRLPFDCREDSRNYLSKLQHYPRVYQNFNSLSHLRECVKACIDLWAMRAPCGIYNVTNPGYVSSREVVDLIGQFITPHREFAYWGDDSEFYKYGAKTQRSNCILDVDKLLGTGVHLQPIEDALASALSDWQSTSCG